MLRLPPLSGLNKRRGVSGVTLNLVRSEKTSGPGKVCSGTPLPPSQREDKIAAHAQDPGPSPVTDPAVVGGAEGTSSRRISAVVALTLLEVIRHQDLPREVLESEDPSVTMPRRLGLSEVIDRQIRRYREEVKRRERITDDEFRDLVRLVIRRPDSEEVFFHVGAQLAGDDRPPGWWRGLPRALGYGLARRRTRRQLIRLFGRRVGGFASGPFTLEARSHLFIDGDLGGDACNFLTGFCTTVLQRYCGRRARVAHSLCEARRDPLCRWTVLAEERATEEAGARLILNPEPG